MEELDRLISNTNIDTNHLSLDNIQNVLFSAKRCKKSLENNIEKWNRLSEILWRHIQNGLEKIDDQLLCATCFFSVIILTDKQEYYMNKMDAIIEKEIILRSTDLNDNSSSLQAASLMYGMFQSSFLSQSTEKSNFALVINSTFNLLTLMGYEYSQFTFIAFKTMKSFKKVCGTDLQNVIFSKENQIKLLNLTNHNWENPITGVRDLNKEIFQTLISIFDEVTLKDIVQEINSFYWNKAKYLMVSEVIENYTGNVTNILLEYNWIKGLINSLHKPGLVSAGSDMYYAVLKKINCEEVWCEIFLHSIIDILKETSNKKKSPSKAVEHFANYWLLITLKKFPSLMKTLIDELEKFDSNDHLLYSKLCLMKQGNKLGILDRHWGSTDNPTKTQKIILRAIDHYNTQVRILAFDIICFTTDKTLPREIEYKLIVNYIKNNVNSDCTVLRLNMLSSLNTFLSQLHILFRNMKANCDTNDLLEFCRSLQQLIIHSLNLHGNYQRKSTNVKVINIIIDGLSEIPRKRKDHIKVSSTSLKDFLNNNGNWKLQDEEIVLKLISLLMDPSEDIRENVGKLLLKHFSEDLRKTEVMNKLVQDALKSMKSKFFFEISCGQSMFKLIVNLLLKENQCEAIFKSLEEVFNYGYTELFAEYNLKQDVLKSIEDGKQLHSFVSILQVVLEVSIKNSYKLDILDVKMTDLLDVLQGITNQFTWEQKNATSSDFSKMNEMVENIITKSGYNSAENDETKISGLHQIVLNCLWLNVKACCDLASLLINYYKDDFEKCEKCLAIITHVLETSRHKGAIEAAGAALGSGIQLLTSLAEDSTTSKLPQTLLKTKLDILIFEAGKMASITRRGAGLSIMVHRIVSSDMRKGKPLFHYFMKTILKTCLNTEDIPSIRDMTDVENQTDLPKAIFIHFLTKIVTDSSLASDMMFYSAELAELAFGNLTSPHWQIRNAALQLYGALIPKLIGQKKASGSDDETIATVACDELRTHSPKLWMYITEQLKNDNHSNNINSHSNLIPILNMLASSAVRYNFSYDSREQTSSDRELLNSLVRVLDSPIYTVRRLTARCIFNIISFNNICDVLLKVDFISENFIHGALLLFECCCKYYNLEGDDTAKALEAKYRNVLKNKDNVSYCCQEVNARIYSESKNLGRNDVEQILIVLDKHDHLQGVFNWAQTCIENCILNIKWEGLPEVLHLLLNCKEFEIYCEILLHKIESEDCNSEGVMIQIANTLLCFEKRYQSSVIWKILYQISLIINLDSVNVTRILKDLDGKESCYKLKYVIPFAARLFINIDGENQKKLTDIIYELCDFENTDVDMRQIAALANNELSLSFDLLSANIKVASLKTVIILLQDEDEDVRDICVDYYKNIVKLDVAVQPHVCLYLILDTNFLRSIFGESQLILGLCKDLLKLLANNRHNIDKNNPFANDSKNIYLEVDVLQKTLENIMHSIE